MLRKLLKYDFKYIFKIWLALSVLSVPMSAFGGFCLPMSIQGSEFDGFFIFGTIISFFVIFGAALIPFVMSLYRFYLNLYTDEGYLTFTLPVKKSDLLLSKFIFSMSTLVAGGIALAVHMMFPLGNDIVGIIGGLAIAGLGVALSLAVKGLAELINNSQKNAHYLSRLVEKQKEKEALKQLRAEERERAKLEKEIKDLRAEYVSTQQILINKKKLINLREQIEEKDLGLKESKTPAYTISVNGK